MYKYTSELRADELGIYQEANFKYIMQRTTYDTSHNMDDNHMLCLQNCKYKITISLGTK
jgi:hypothetical protein